MMLTQVLSASDSITHFKTISMRTISSFFKRVATSPDYDNGELAINPSEVLHVYCEEITGTLEITSLNGELLSASPLKVSWIKNESLTGQMRPVWINEEQMLS
jgi:hypothetical protein